MQGGSFAASPINVSRLTFRRMTTLPAPSKPTTLHTFLPRSTPRTEIVAITLPPFDLRRAYDAGRRGGPFHKDRACRGAAAPGRLEAAPGMVWGATRPRSEKTRFHR